MTALHPLWVQSLFVAGTDTGVGKTFVSVQLLRSLKDFGHQAAGMKPVAAGAVRVDGEWRNDDALALQRASGVALPYHLVNPYCLARATSPHLAARSSGKIVEISVIKSAFDAISLKANVIIVEGAGGWLTPVGEAERGQIGPTLADVAVALNLPVLLVVGLRLGCINHALLTAQAIHKSGLTLAGWYANALDPTFADRDEYIESLAQRIAAPRLTLPTLTIPEVKGTG
jgi:dethiobiotin synthetase